MVRLLRGIEGIRVVRTLRERVLNRRVLRIKLAWEVGLGDHVVMWREMVSLIAKRADPDLGCEVDPRERVEDGGARLAPQRRVWERGYIRVGTDR